MKKITVLLLALCMQTFGYSQKEKVEQQSYSVPPNKEVSLNLKFAQEIKVESTSAAELGLKTILTYRQEKDLKIHQLKVENDGGQLQITADMNTDYLKSQGENTCWDCEERDCLCFKVAFVVMVPKGVKVNLETISGNIEIPQLKNAIQAKSISGFIDVGLDPSAKKELVFKSVTGEIYTDFDLQLDENSTPFSKKLNAPLNGGGELVALETISGDIFFRKK